MTLSGKFAIITGASRGLGAEIAAAYVRHGCSVILAARSVKALEDRASALRATANPSQKILVQQCDVASEAQIDALIDHAHNAFGRIDILVANAGVYGPMGMTDEVSWEDWKTSFEINVMGVVYPCRRIAPFFRAQGSGKIIALSGGGATNPLPRITSYAASKAAVVRFCESIALELKEHGIDVNTVAPGALATYMLDEIIAAGPERVGAQFHERMLKIKDEGGASLETAANLCVWLGSSASDGVTGRLLSAQWDPWADLQNHRDDIDATDIYTLRRITPRDRGKTWGG